MRKKRNIKRKIFYASAFVIISILLILSFLQLDVLAKENNQLKNYTQKINQLSKKKENLEITFLNKNNLNNIESIAKELNFEKTRKFHYIRILEGTVVAK